MWCLPVLVMQPCTATRHGGWTTPTSRALATSPTPTASTSTSAGEAAFAGLCAASSLLTLHGLVSRHVHNYERFYPEYNGAVDKSCVTSPGVYTDPKFMVTLVAGSPGCQEHISSENGPADALAVKSHTCMYCPSPPARCASHVCVVVSQTASACSPRTTRHTPRGSGCKR